MNTASSPANGNTILHIGLGSFHRAHQSVYLHHLRESGDCSWSIVGANIRNDMADTMSALIAQNGEYTIETVSPTSERRYERIRSIREVIPFDIRLARLIDVGANPATRIISFTVTEAGYYLDTKNKLDLSYADLRADLEGQACGTIYGVLNTILHERVKRGGAPVTLLNCDNLRSNGTRFRSGLLDFLDRRGDTVLRDWVGSNTSSPNAMVDRITPRPPPEVRERVKAATGWDDDAPVMAESFIQWVIEENFCNGRPAWENVGVQMVASVAPYEEAKIRILNASHSCIAWAGTLVGCQFIHEGTRDAVIRQFARDYVTDDVIPCLTPSPIDLANYRDVVLERFGNPAICDTNQRVAMDAYSKIPGFIAPTIRERLANNQSIAGVAMLPALFLAFLQRWHRGTIPYAYQDQGMDAAAAHGICNAADPVAAFCSDRVLWGPQAGDQRLIAAIREATARVIIFLKEHGQ